MVKYSAVLFISILLFGCRERAENAVQTKQPQVKTTTLSDSLHKYFSSYEIEPLIVINNDDEKQTNICFLNHHIEWLDCTTETKIKIDNDLFSLAKEVTLNKVWDNHDSVDFANNWDQVKYFKVDGEEIIGIRMSFYPCTGIGCDADYFLIYDLRHKTKNFFGQFRAARELKLYHFHNNSQIDYLSTTYDGDSDGVAKETAIVYELFSLSDNGKFILEKDGEGKPYYIKHITPIEDTSNIKETLQTRWFEKSK